MTPVANGLRLAADIIRTEGLRPDIGDPHGESLGGAICRGLRTAGAHGDPEVCRQTMQRVAGAHGTDSLHAARRVSALDADHWVRWLRMIADGVET